MTQSFECLQNIIIEMDKLSVTGDQRTNLLIDNVLYCKTCKTLIQNCKCINPIEYRILAFNNYKIPLEIFRTEDFKLAQDKLEEVRQTNTYQRVDLEVRNWHKTKF